MLASEHLNTTGLTKLQLVEDRQIETLSAKIAEMKPVPNMGCVLC